MPTICIQLHTQCPPRRIYQHNSIYQSYKLNIWMSIQLLQTKPVQDKLSPTNSSWPNRSLLPILGDALQWLTGTTTTKDMTEIKKWINLLMQEQTKQQKTLVHIIFILNATQYTIQVNRQKLNEVMDSLQKGNEHVINYLISQTF